MIIFVDIDNTICYYEENTLDYSKAKPYLDKDTIKTALPIGSIVASKSGEGWDVQEDDIRIVDNTASLGNVIKVSEPACVNLAGCDDGAGGTIAPLEAGALLSITKPNGILFSVEIEEILPEIIGDDFADMFKIDGKLLNANYRLNWHNCY